MCREKLWCESGLELDVDTVSVINIEMYLYGLNSEGVAWSEMMYILIVKWV